MTDVIAERVLHFEGSPERRVFIRILMPQVVEESLCGCTYRIEAPKHTKEFTAFGVDTFQALKCAYVMIGGEIAYLERQEGSRLVFEDGSPADV